MVVRGGGAVSYERGTPVVRRREVLEHLTGVPRLEKMVLIMNEASRGQKLEE